MCGEPTNAGTVDVADSTITHPADTAEAAEAANCTTAAESANSEVSTGAVDCEDAAANCEDAAANDEDATDPADTLDANLLETLVQDFNCRAAVNPEQALSDQPQSVGPQPSGAVPPPCIHLEHGNPGGPSQSIIESFPHGSPGAPIPGVHQGSHAYQSSQEAFGPSIWAPFHSQCDWEIARWAKMRGATSSAVADLLAIPEVRATTFDIFYDTNAN